MGRRAHKPDSAQRRQVEAMAAYGIPVNERKIPTARGLRWHVSSVANLLARAQRLEAVR